MADNTGAAAAALAGSGDGGAGGGTAVDHGAAGATGGAAQESGATAAAQGASTAPAWTQGWDAEDVGYVEKKGYKDVKDLYTAYRNAERLISNDKIPLPKDGADPKEWDQVWSKLGRPDTPDQYKAPEGADPDMFKAMAQGFHKAGLSNDRVAELTKAYNDYVGTLIQTQEKTYLDDQSAAMKTLESEWGKEMPKEIEFNRRAMRALGLSVDDVTRYMQGGAEKMLRLLNLAGRSIAEDNAGDIASNETLGFGLTPTRAAAELAELKANKDFMARVTRREPMAMAKYNRLIKAYAEGGTTRKTINSAY